MKLKLFVISVSALTMSGCLSMNTYVDPQYSDLSFASVELSTDTAYNLKTELLTNGKPNARGSKTMMEVAEKVFTKGGISLDENAPGLNISCDNVADMGDAAAKGFGTGLTLGMMGSTVTDGYECTFTLDSEDGEMAKTYKHALHSTIGNADAPIENVEAVSPIIGFEHMLEDLVIKFLMDIGEDKVAYNYMNYSLLP